MMSPQLEKKVEKVTIFKRFLLWGVVALIALSVFQYNFPNWLFVEVLKDETVTVDLIGSEDSKNLVYEDDNFEIKIGYNDFETYIQEQNQQIESVELKSNEIVAQDPKIEAFNRWKEDIDARIADKESLYFDPYADRFLVAEFLEVGKATVFDKTTEKTVETIRIRTYSYVCGSLCGAGARTFYLPNRSILKPRGLQFF